jgi:hypothetical protein
MGPPCACNPSSELHTVPLSYPTTPKVESNRRSAGSPCGLKGRHVPSCMSPSYVPVSFDGVPHAVGLSRHVDPTDSRVKKPRCTRVCSIIIRDFSLERQIYIPVVTERRSQFPQTHTHTHVCIVASLLEVGTSTLQRDPHQSPRHP